MKLSKEEFFRMLMRNPLLTVEEKPITGKPLSKSVGMAPIVPESIKPIKKGHSKIKPLSKLESNFLSLWEYLNGQELVNEFKFHPVRRWRVDFFHMASNTAVEIEGGAFSKNGHRTITNFNSDMEKYNAMSFLGISLFRFSAKTITEENLRKLIQFIDRKIIIDNK